MAFADSMRAVSASVVGVAALINLMALLNRLATFLRVFTVSPCADLT
jgi:hypothetical protein